MSDTIINQRQIHWFPGHMAKTLRMMEREIRNVDCVLQVLDARIPLSSLNPEIERITGIETRATVLGHIQRGGSPSGFDRGLATRLGLHAADAVVDGAWGQMVALKGTDIVRVPFIEALGELNQVPQYRYEEAAALFG